MKKFKHIIISFIIVFIINYSFIFAFAYSREDVYKNALPECNISRVVLQNNDFVKLSDYKLLNWEYGDNKEEADEVLDILSKSEYMVVDKPEQVVIRFLQNRFNSLTQIWLEPDNYQKFDYEWRKNAESASMSVEVVKFFGEYYLIGDYLLADSVSEDNKVGDSGVMVYKALSPDKINEIDEHKGLNSFFDSYSFYPIDLSPFVSTLFGKILNITFVFLETYIVYILIKCISNRVKPK